MNDDILNAAVASIEETREANFRNVDNHDLGHWKHFAIGDVREVNGLWADVLMREKSLQRKRRSPNDGVIR